jgi:hypothetical protein
MTLRHIVVTECAVRYLRCQILDLILCLLCHDVHEKCSIRRAALNVQFLVIGLRVKVACVADGCLKKQKNVCILRFDFQLLSAAAGDGTLEHNAPRERNAERLLAYRVGSDSGASLQNKPRRFSSVLTALISRGLPLGRNC